MKYKDMPKDMARQICKQNSYKKDNYIITKCETCPLRRTREKNGKEQTKMCYFRLIDLYEDIDQERKELEEEEIKHLENLEK